MGTVVGALQEQTSMVEKFFWELFHLGNQNVVEREVSLECTPMSWTNWDGFREILKKDQGRMLVAREIMGNLVSSPLTLEIRSSQAVPLSLMTPTKPGAQPRL